MEEQVRRETRREERNQGRKEGKVWREIVYRYVRKCNLSQCFPVKEATVQFSFLNFEVVCDFTI